MVEMFVAEMSIGRNVRGRNVLAEMSLAEMSVAEMSEHRGSDGPTIDYNRKSVGLGLPIATINSKMQQSIVIGAGTQSTVTCNCFSHCYHAVEYMYYIHASIDFTATFQFVLQRFLRTKNIHLLFSK